MGKVRKTEGPVHRTGLSYFVFILNLKYCFMSHTYRVSFTHSAPMLVQYCNSREDAIRKAILRLRDWDGKTTKTQKRKCIVSAKIYDI